MVGAIGMSNRYIIPTSNVSNVTPINTENNVENSVRVKQVECQTCKNRKYVDGSNESDVSFKSPGHIDPGQSYATVMSHEQEHMSNARQKTADSDTRLVSASVSLKISVCPECGRSYVAGGTTNTTIQYSESNPYDKGRKTIEGSFLRGQNFDEAV
jgi:hypothetical protein